MKTTLDEMQAFIAVVDSGSITAAANELGLTISATSRTLSRLEDKLKTTLMRRTTRRMELTEEGLAYLPQARAIVASVEASEALMSTRLSVPSGRLRVDAASPFMLHVIVPIVQGYRARYPQVQLELSSNEGIIDLLERRTDLAIRIGALEGFLAARQPHRRQPHPAGGQLRPIWRATARRPRWPSWPAIPCWASASPTRSIPGRCRMAMARLCTSCPPSPRRAEKPCASWPCTAPASPACRTS